MMEVKALKFKVIKVCVYTALCLIILLIINSLTSLACIDPTAAGSIEVVLNKPGVSYDLGILGGLRNVIKLQYEWSAETSYLYRSHVSKDIIVIVSTQAITLSKNSPKYISIRVESPIIYVNKTLVSYEGHLTVSNVSVDMNEIREIAKDLGWIIEISGNRSVFKGYLQKVIDDVKVKIFLTIMSNEALMDVYIESYHEIKEYVIKSVNTFLSKLIKTDTFLKLEKKESVIKNPTPKVSEDILKDALAYELKWLKDIGVVTGFTDKDISDVISVAKPRYAGWNDRLIYYNGKWLPYSQAVPYIENATLIKFTGCGWVYPLENIPQQPPEFSPTSTATPLLTRANEYLAILIVIGIALAVALAVKFIVKMR